MRLPPADLRFGRQRLYAHSAEAMPELPDRSVDVIVTSPPYNRGKRYHPSYSDRQPEEAYRRLLVRVFRECHRVLADRGVFFLNIGDGASDQGKSERVCRWAQEEGFHRAQTLIWVKSILGKGHFTPSGGGRSFSNLFEYIFLLSKRPHPELDVKAVGIPYADKSNVGRYSEVDLRDAGNVWFIPYRETTGATVKKGHDAPFPVELPWRAIRAVPRARVVLDPFAGTGSTLSAAESLGRTGIGYEPFPLREVIERRLRTPFLPPPIVLVPELERALGAVAELFPQVWDPSLPLTSRRRKADVETARRLLVALGHRPATRGPSRTDRLRPSPARGKGSRAARGGSSGRSG